MDHLTELQSYLHLNTSFSDDIGLVGGKVCSALFFSGHSDDYYRTDITFDFVSEILDQIGPNSPYSYGQGIAGVGALLTYLATRGILDADVNELVEDFDQRLVKTINAGLVTDTGLTEGLSGYALYLLTRLESGVVEPYDLEYISSCIAYIAERLLDFLSSNTTATTDLSIWTGLCGVYMVLSHLAERGLLQGDKGSQLANHTAQIFNLLIGLESDWEQLPLYFVLVNCGEATIGSIEKDLIWSEFNEFLSKSVLRPVAGLTEAAFYAALLKYCSLQPQGRYCAEISLRLAEQVFTILNTTSLKTIYPYNFGTRNVDVGMRTGAGGAALALTSLIHNDFNWFRILGYNAE